jgi:hypothetical protein
MPAQDRLGCDQERRPPFSWHKTGEEGDQCPVRPGEAGSGDLAAKDRYLVAQHKNLCVLREGVHAMGRHDLDDATDQAVEETECHGPEESPLGPLSVKPGSLSWTLQVLSAVVAR